MKLNYQSLLAAAISVSLALPGAAMADRRGHDDRGHDRDRYSGHHRDRHVERHVERHVYRDYGDRHVHRVYRDRDGDDLLIGLVVGGILGYAINSAQQSNIDYNRYPPSAQPNAYPATDSYSYSDSSCLQEREYTTTVRVGGRNVEAYGTACLQPDGSWKRGPAEMASY